GCLAAEESLIFDCKEIPVKKISLLIFIFFCVAGFSSCKGKKTGKNDLKIIVHLAGGNSDKTISAIEHRLDDAGISSGDYDVRASGEGIDVSFAEKLLPDLPLLKMTVSGVPELTIRDNYSIFDQLKSLQHLDSMITGDLKDPAATGNTCQCLGAVYLPTGFSRDIVVDNFREQVAIGYAQAKDTAFVDSVLCLPLFRGMLPDDVILLWTAYPSKQVTSFGDFYGLVPAHRSKNLCYTPMKFIKADAQKEKPIPGTPSPGTYHLVLQTDPPGAYEWRKFTQLNNGRSISMEIEGRSYSCPIIRGEISGGIMAMAGIPKEKIDLLKAAFNPEPLPENLHVTGVTLRK
ncbi:MAG TPA: hypothetical protein VFU15_07900, partial [Bacteroidia bacterium]|nr:hypothetical protein [Bacteroidia bacterium]